MDRYDSPLRFPIVVPITHSPIPPTKNQRAEAFVFFFWGGGVQGWRAFGV